MNIVPATDVLRKLYEDTQHKNIEYASSSFWQVLLQGLFPEEEYIVVCEYPPDLSRRRVDIVVRLYDLSQHTLASFIFHECKRPDGSASEVEKQVFSVAKLAIQADNLTGVYVVTTIGTSFRMWFLSSKERRLMALHGTNAGSLHGYIDIDSDVAYELPAFIQLAKESPPLWVAHVLLSQSLADLPELGDGAGGDEGWDQNTAEGWDGAGDGGYMGEEGGMAGVQYGGYTPAGDPGEQAVAAGLSGAPTRNRIRDIPVMVSKVPHNRHPDEYVYKDHKGRDVKTAKKDWVEDRDGEGQRIWTHQREGHTTRYISRDRQHFS